MFHRFKIGSLFRQAPDPLKTLSTDQSKKILLFSENLTRLDSIINEETSADSFIKLAAIFSDVFGCLDNVQASSERILETYSSFVTNFLRLIDPIFEKITDPNFEHVFASLALIGDQLGDGLFEFLRNSSLTAEKFIPLICQIIKTAKTEERILQISAELLKYLFIEPSIFDEFVMIDGFTLVFSSFFITNNKEAIETIMILLFQIVPPTFYSTVSPTTIDICLDALNPAAENTTIQCCPECALFLCNYLALLFNSNPDVFDNFENHGGFVALNNYFLTYCDNVDKFNEEKNGNNEKDVSYDDSSERFLKSCYSTMMKKGGVTNSILNGLHNLYMQSKPKYRTVILKLLEEEIDVSELLNITPIDNWVIFDNDASSKSKDGQNNNCIFITTKEQFKIIIKIMYKTDISGYIPFIFKLIENGNVKSNNDDLKLDKKLLKLINQFLTSKKIESSVLIRYNILSTFIFRSDIDYMSHFFSDIKYFPPVLIEVFKAKDCECLRPEIISKIISLYQESMKSCLKTLLSVDFSSEIFVLMMSNIIKKEICDIFVEEITETDSCPKYFEYFLNCNGFKIFTSVMDQWPDHVVKLVGALTYKGPKKEIDEWILNDLTSDSPFFKQRELIHKITINSKNNNFLNVPSLLMYCEDMNKANSDDCANQKDNKPLFNINSPICLYNAGKYGIPMYLKNNREITKDVSNYQKILNRFITPTIINNVRKDINNFPNFVDVFMPQCEVFEIVGNGLHSCFYFNEKDFVKNICFRFSIPPNISNANTIVFQLNNCLVIDYNNEELFVSTKFGQNSFPLKFNDFSNQNKFKFIKVSINFASNDKVNVNFHDMSNINSSINQIEMSLKIEANSNINHANNNYNSNSLTFGDGMCSLIIDRNITINDHLAMFENKTGNHVYKVKCNNFSNYFTSDKIRLEYMFQRLENKDSNNINSFTFIYTTFLHIIHTLNESVRKGNYFLRLLLSLKRCEASVRDNLLFYFHQLPSTILDEAEMALFIVLTLKDYEFYFVFQKQLIISYMNLIKNDLSESKILIKKFIESKMDTYLVSVMRHNEGGEINYEILDLILEILICSTVNNKNNNTQINYFIKNALTAGHWSLHLSADKFPTKSLIDLSIPDSELQIAFLNILVKSIKSTYNNKGNEINVVNERLQCNQLLDFSLFFDDERALPLLEIISFYSTRNPNYVQDSALLSFAFSRLAEYEKTWKIAFSILSGKDDDLENFPTNLTITKPVFSQVILFMLNRLLSLQAMSVFRGDSEIKYSDLVEKIFNILLNIPLKDYTIFAHELKIISMLSNFGIIPPSIQQSFVDSEGNKSTKRTPIISLFPNSVFIQNENISEISLTQGDIPPIFRDIEIMKSPEIFECKLSCCLMKETFPEDLVNCDWVELLPLNHLVNFITNILLANNLNNFLQIAVGNALMYTPYQRKFACELILSVLLNFPQADKHASNPLPVALRAAKGSIFSKCYIRFLNSVINLMKNRYDQSCIKEFREILILSYSFIINEEEQKSRDQLFVSNEKLIFIQPMMEDVDFISVLSVYGGPPIADMLQDYMKKNSSIFASRNAANKRYSDIETAKRMSEIEATVSIYFDHDSRVNKANNIIKFLNIYAHQTTKSVLLSRIERIVFLYNSAKGRFSGLKDFCRKYEFNLFKFIQNEYLYNQNYSKTIPVNSFFLSQSSCMPYHSPRVLSPSPFLIKSPPYNENVDISSNNINNYNNNYENNNNNYDNNNNINKNNNLTNINNNQNEGNTNTNGIDLNSSQKLQNSLEIFKIGNSKPPSNKIHHVDVFGRLCCSAEWCQESRIFEYSQIFDSDIILDFQKIYGNYKGFLEIEIYYFIHSFPCLLFFYDNKIRLLLLATKSTLIDGADKPIALIPLNQQILLNDFHNVSLFCGHFVLTFDDDRFIRMDQHYYIHVKRCVSLFYMYDPNIILVFENLNDLDVFSQRFSSIGGSDFNSTLPPSVECNSSLLFNVSIKEVMQLWIENKISSFDYLVYLNFTSLRSFTDSTQYPVFPWINSCSSNPEEFEERDLSLPMGQLSKQRSQHYDELFDAMDPPYFYGCHYSNPAIVFWFLMRIPPFNYFLWDLNDGWDDPSRMFQSVEKSYECCSKTNPTDLKEQVPEMFSVPELFYDSSGLGCIPDSVVLPKWSNKSPDLFVKMSRKYFEENEDLNKWIDLIFGNKQNGENAIKSKNVFLPTSYHAYDNPESLMMTEEVFEKQVNNFGQCPDQIFKEFEHPKRDIYKRYNKSEFVLNIVNANENFEDVDDEFEYIKYFNYNQKIFKMSMNGSFASNGKIVPLNSVAVPPSYEFVIQVERNELLTIRRREDMELVSSTFDNEAHLINHISISRDGIFMVISYESGFSRVYQLIYSNDANDKQNINTNTSFSENTNEAAALHDVSSLSNNDSHNLTIFNPNINLNSLNNCGYGVPLKIRKVQSFSQNSECLMSEISSRDFLVFSIFKNKKLILWNFSTMMKHREFDLKSILLNSPIGEEFISTTNFFESENSNAYREDSYEEKPIQMIFDDFDGCLSILTKSKVIQYSINGLSKLRECDLFDDSSNDDDGNDPFNKELNKLRNESSGNNLSVKENVNNLKLKKRISLSSSVSSLSSMLDQNTTFSLLPLSNSFDERIIVVGNSNGSLTFLAVNKSNNQLDVIGKKEKVLKYPIGSIFAACDKDENIYVSDWKYNAIILKADKYAEKPKPKERCKNCMNELSKRCEFCGAQICPNCSIKNMCRNCIIEHETVAAYGM